MSRLVLIDGNAILHRAYHALPPMNNSQGQQTNAVYGFISIFFKVINDLQPTHMAVTFDREKPTFRKLLFKEYQAQRPKMEDKLASQVDLVHEVLKTMKIPIYEIDGFEADDVIATLAKQATEKSNKLKDSSSINEVVVVTGDRDLLQLVNKKIKLYMPVKGLSEAKLFGEKEVEERMGVPPKQIPDLKALMGDPSDNYPGVAGVGPKTAISLLQQFGSIDNLYQKLPSIKTASLAEKLMNDKKNALLSQKLATIVIDAPVKLNSEKTRLSNLATSEAIKLFGKLEFKSLLKRLLNLNKKENNSNKNKSTVETPVKNQLGLF